MMGLKDVWNNAKKSAKAAVVDAARRIVASDVMEKAATVTPIRENKAEKIPPEATPEELIGLMADPFALVETLGYRERYSSVSYDALNRMSYYVPIYPTILQTRRNQCASFCAPQTDQSLPGFRIGLRDRKKRASKKDQIRAQELEEWMVNTGSSDQLTRDPLEAAVRKLVRDAMVYDQFTFEKVRNRKGAICDWYPLDGASIRIADTAWKEGPRSDDDVHYVQVHDETVIAEFTPNNLCFGVRNPRSDLRVNGYGESELEMGIKIGTALINGWHYNAKFFENGTVAKGMLNIPDIPQSKLRIFAQQWHMMTSGMINAWRTPITNFKQADWVDLQKSNKDMEWAEFINFSIKLMAGICQMDPAELHMQFGNVGQTQQMFQAPAEEKIKYSKDKGLRPLLSFIAQQFNRHLIWQLDPDLCFYFTGLDPRDSQQAVDIEKKQVSYLKTVNEMRIENDETPLSPEEGDVILDPTWMQNHMAIRQEALQREMAEKEQAQQEQEMAQQEEDEEQAEEENASPANAAVVGDGYEASGDFDSLMDQAEKSLKEDEPIGGQIKYEIEW
jgi:hypothetical protein